MCRAHCAVTFAIAQLSCTVLDPEGVPNVNKKPIVIKLSIDICGHITRRIDLRSRIFKLIPK